MKRLPKERMRSTDRQRKEEEQKKGGTKRKE